MEKLLIKWIKEYKNLLSQLVAIDDEYPTGTERPLNVIVQYAKLQTKYITISEHVKELKNLIDKTYNTFDININKAIEEDNDENF